MSDSKEFMIVNNMDNSSELLWFVRTCRGYACVPLLPGHGLHIVGADAILCHLQSRAELLRTLRHEVLNGWRQHGGEPDVAILTRWLVERSPLFRLWSHAAFPKHMVLPFNMVSTVLTEEGLLQRRDQLP